jgi:hypothetical protein
LKHFLYSKTKLTPYVGQIPLVVLLGSVPPLTYDSMHSKSKTLLIEKLPKGLRRLTITDDEADSPWAWTFADIYLFVDPYVKDWRTHSPDLEHIKIRYLRCGLQEDPKMRSIMLDRMKSSFERAGIGHEIDSGADYS